MPTRPEWGWRVQCDHPGCGRSYQRWSSGPGSGPPSLSIPREEWFLFSERGNSRTYHSFCPEHSGPATQYLDDLWKWKNARRDHGRSVVHSCLEELKNIFFSRSPVEEWEKKNPRPTPPWEK